MNAGNMSMAAVYSVLALFWFGVIAVLIWLAVQGRRKAMASPGYLGFLSASLFVAFAIFVDSSYWAITNLSRIKLLDPSIEPLLRDPSLVALVKSLLLISAIVFLVVASRAAGLLGQGFEDNICASFIDRTWDAIGILDEHGRVTLWNRGAETLFGFPRDAVVGKHIKEFLVPKHLHEEIDRRLQQVRATKVAALNYSTQRLTRDGRLLDVEISISPILGSHFEGFFGIMRKWIPHIASRYFADRELLPGEKPYIFWGDSIREIEGRLGVCD